MPGIVAIIVLFTVSITVKSPPSPKYNLLPSGLIAIAVAEILATESVIVFELVFITNKASGLYLQRYTLEPSGLTQIPPYISPTGIIAITELVLVLITLT